MFKRSWFGEPTPIIISIKIIEFQPGETLNYKYRYNDNTTTLITSRDKMEKWLVCCTQESRVKGQGSNPGRVTVLCSCVRQLTLTLPLCTDPGAYCKWVMMNEHGSLMKC